MPADAIHQEVDLSVSPEQIYGALTDADVFAAFTGVPAEIANQAGGAFSLFGGQIIGRNIELLANRRVVQAWRSKTWDEGVYSIARFELTRHANGCRLVFDQTGFPEADREHLYQGWHRMYWDPLRKFFA